MSNSKNILQEYCQKNNIAFPKYNSWREPNDSDHSPKWFAVCIFGGSEFKSKHHETSKKLAEIQSANFALTKVSHLQEITTYSQLDVYISDTIEYIIIADIENINLLKLVVGKNVMVIGFSCSSYHMIDKYLDIKWHHVPTFIELEDLILSKRQFNLLTINDKVSDLADHYMTAYLCNAVVKQHTNYKYIILTNDHAGWCTSSIVKHINNLVFIKNYSSLNILKSELSGIVI